ncbi:MAG: efflux RND transporter periplasmic adaptor subunit [Victivallaceae bacterium]|nr:efflux RND transporter periplasmic adaptor subunit [Victivallaceae bacterium]
MMKHEFAKIFLCTALFAAGVPAFASGRDAAVPHREKVLVGKVGSCSETISRRLAGTVVAIYTYDVVPRISGDIVNVNFKDGTVVQKGQLLFEIDDVRYKAAVQAAQAKVDDIKAQIDYASGNYDRNERLFQKKAVSLDTRDNTKSNLASLQAQLQAAEAELILAQDDLDHTKIRAHYDGKTSKALYTIGRYVTPSTGTLVTVSSTTPIRVRFSLSERDLLKFFGNEEKLRKTGRVALKLADGSLYPHPGVIEIVDNVSVIRETDSIQVWARFDNPDYILNPGASVSVILSKEDPEMYPAVPRQAIVFDRRGARLCVVGEGDKIEIRPVELGSVNGALQVIRAGVKPGERIVVEGMHKIMDGSVVDPVEMQE